MKVYALSIITQSPAKQLVTECDLSSFSFFQRSSAQEFLNFFVVTLAERTAPNTRQKIEENSNILMFMNEIMSVMSMFEGMV
jgi:synaptobrevin family protein YKT6